MRRAESRPLQHARDGARWCARRYGLNLSAVEVAVELEVGELEASASVWSVRVRAYVTHDRADSASGRLGRAGAPLKGARRAAFSRISR